MQYYSLDGRVVVDAAALKLILTASTGLSTGTTPAPSTGTGTSTGTSGGTTGGGTSTGGTAPATAKVTGLKIDRIDGTTIYYSWDAYAGAADYRAEIRARDGANATDAWTGIANTTATSESKGGLPNNTTYELHVLARANGATIATSDPVTVVFGTPGAATGAGNGAGAGTGTGSTGGGTTTPTMPPGVATGAFSAAYPWYVMTGGTDIEVQRVMGNGPGEVPAGHKLTATVDGTPVVVQDLAPATWPDGSRRAGVVSLTLPGTRASGSTANVVFGETSGAPDATVSKSKDAIAADSGFELRLFGFDLDATYVLRMNDLIAGAPSFPYGTNPSRGLDVLDAGPERTRLRGWGFVRRASDGAIHRTLKAYIYLDALKSGVYRAIVRWVQDTTYGAFPGGTVGPDGPTRINFIAELWNKGSRVAVWGGPEDPRARTGDGAAMLNNSRFEPPGGFNPGWDIDFSTPDGPRTWDLGIGVAFSGGVPGGVDTTRVYWPQRAEGGLALGTRRRTTDGAASFGSGSGRVTVYPVMHAFLASGGIGHGINLHPVWVGPGTAPVVQPGHDRVHLLQRSRLTPPMRTDLQQGVITERPPRIHTPGEVYSPDIWNIPATADSGHVSRIGWLPFVHARLLYTPQDPVLWGDVFSTAVSWADFPQQLTDERAGVPPITNRGPADDGVTYPGFAPVNTGLSTMLNGDMDASPKLNPNARASWDKSSEISHGYEEDYQMMDSFAHTPNWWFIPYLLTGDHVWLDMGMSNCTAAGMLFNHQHSAEGKNYSPVITGQPRGMGWAFREWGNFIHVAPDAHPYRRVLEHYQKANFRFYAAQTRVGLGRFIGKLYAHYNNPYEDYGGRPWHDFMLAFAWGIALWRTGDPDLRTAIEGFKIFLFGWFDDQAIPGAGFYVNEYGISANDVDNRFGRGAGYVFQSPAEVIEAHAGGPPPYPASGINGDPFPNSYVAMYVAATAIWSTAGVPGAGRLRKQILRRIFGTEQEIRTSDGPGDLIPHYAVTPGAGAVD